MIKFMVRWGASEVDATALKRWVAELPDEWQDRIDAGGWNELTEDYREYRKDWADGSEQAAATELGSAALTLLKQLSGRFG
jgi:hypothetical protein